MGGSLERAREVVSSRKSKAGSTLNVFQTSEKEHSAFASREATEIQNGYFFTQFVKGHPQSKKIVADLV